MAFVVDGKKISDILYAEKAEALSDEFELEDVIAAINNIENKTD